MVIAAAAGFFLGAFLNDILGGMSLLVLIAGIACIVHTIKKSSGKQMTRRGTRRPFHEQLREAV